jgi:AcrR family transcriptional regulator
MSSRLSAPARREQLLAVALEVFARHGFHGASMNEIAEGAGVTKPVLYQHFASKRELYLALLREVGDRILAEVEAATRTADGPHAKVKAGFDAYFRWVAEDHDAFLLLFGNGAAYDEEFVQAVRHFELAIADAIAPLIQVDIDDDHRRILADGLVGLAEGTSRRLVASGARFDPDRVAVQVADVVWAGLRGVHRV